MKGAGDAIIDSLPSAPISSGRAPGNEERAAETDSFASLCKSAVLGLSRVPSIYMAAIAIVLGDALGNLGFWIPLWAGILALVGAALLYVAARPRAARWLALAGIVAAAALPAFRLYSPAPDRSSIRNFPDRAFITFAGRIRRAPERFPGRTHLFVNIDQAGIPPHPLRPTSGMVRVTILTPNRFRIGDKVKVAGRIRFPYRLGDAGEFDYQAWL
ncbi:MAG: DUF4131 domain-containing protein, partial [Candidatus Binataceae bacterium]